MPIYDYECTGCSYHFEQKKSFADGATAICPQCGCNARRIFVPVPIIFKGSGFYVTDYRGNNGSSAPVKPTEPAKTASTGKSKE